MNAGTLVLAVIFRSRLSLELSPPTVEPAPFPGEGGGLPLYY